MFSFRNKCKTFPAFERINRPKVFLVHPNVRNLLNTIGHLHIPAALPRRKNSLFPLHTKLNGAKNIGMGVVVMGNAPF